MDIEIKENQKISKAQLDPQVNGIYELKEAAKFYADPAGKEAFDTLEAGSSIKVIQEAEGSYILVDYFGSQGYVEVDKLVEN